MRRTIPPRARTHARDRTRARTPEAESDPLVSGWWASVLAGDTDAPHPAYGFAVRVQLHRTRLRLSGELESRHERDELTREAKKRIGHGIGSVDVSALSVVSRHEKPGILDQTLISAFPTRVAAELARDFVTRHSRIRPKDHDVIDGGHVDRLRAMVPDDFVKDACKAIDEGFAVLIVRVDETDAFRVRELLDEDTRSLWTIAMPPRLSEN